MLAVGGGAAGAARAEAVRPWVLLAKPWVLLVQPRVLLAKPWVLLAKPWVLLAKLNDLLLLAAEGATGEQAGGSARSPTSMSFGPAFPADHRAFRSSTDFSDPPWKDSASAYGPRS
jgi:hypothetical protein